jgi:hypothetical protein
MLVIERIDTRCRMDADCPSKLACFSGECKNPCVEAKPCAANAICTVIDTLPLRTMSCTCEPGYIGDADRECKLGEETSINNKQIFKRKKTNQSFLVFL